MFKHCLFYLLALIPLSVYSSEYHYKNILTDLVNLRPLYCHGEPQWKVTPLIRDDPWLTGRLKWMAEAGFARHQELNGPLEWVLTPANAKMPLSLDDACYGRMLMTLQNP